MNSFEESGCRDGKNPRHTIDRAKLDGHDGIARFDQGGKEGT